MAANQGAKIKLYWLDKSRAQRFVWLFEELNLDYEVIVFKRKPDMLAPPELKEIHALGKSPVISVQGPNADKPMILAESGAIVEYILDHFGKDMLPPKWKEGQENQIGGETEEYMRYRYYMHYAEGSLMPFMVFALVMMQVREAPGMPFFVKPIPRIVAGEVERQFINPNLKTHLEFLEGELRKTDGGFFCGPRLTGADFMLQFPLDAGATRAGLTQDKYPLLHGYLKRMSSREAYTRAIKKIEDITGEPFQSLTEPAKPKSKKKPKAKL